MIDGIFAHQRLVTSIGETLIALLQPYKSNILDMSRLNLMLSKMIFESRAKRKNLVPFDGPLNSSGGT